MGVEWVKEVPAPPRTRRGKWWRICNELRSRPHQWAKVHVGNNTGFATSLKHGKIGGAEPGEFEAVCRRNINGEYEIYARYVGSQGGALSDARAARNTETHKGKGERAS